MKKDKIESLVFNNTVDLFQWLYVNNDDFNNDDLNDVDYREIIETELTVLCKEIKAKGSAFYNNTLISLSNDRV